MHAVIAILALSAMYGIVQFDQRTSARRTDANLVAQETSSTDSNQRKAPPSSESSSAPATDSHSDDATDDATDEAAAARDKRPTLGQRSFPSTTLPLLQGGDDSH